MRGLGIQPDPSPEGEGRAKASNISHLVAIECRLYDSPPLQGLPITHKLKFFFLICSTSTDPVGVEYE